MGVNECRLSMHWVNLGSGNQVKSLACYPHMLTPCVTPCVGGREPHPLHILLHLGGLLSFWLYGADVYPAFGYACVCHPLGRHYGVNPHE